MKDKEQLSKSPEVHNFNFEPSAPRLPEDFIDLIFEPSAPVFTLTSNQSRLLPESMAYLEVQ